MGPKKASLAQKGGKDSPKKIDPPPDPWIIKLTILEVHNLLQDGRENIVNVSFMNEALVGEGDITFCECECRSDSNPLSTWTLTLKQIDERIIMDISSQSLLVSISKTGSPPRSAEDSDSQTVASLPDLISHCCVDLYDLVADEVRTIKSRAYVYPEETLEGPQMKTLPKRPYIKYILSVSKPILEKKNLFETCGDSDLFITMTIATEFIMHPPEVIFEDDIDFEVNISLPLEEQVTKTVTFKQGFRCQFVNIPPFKTRFGLSQLRGEAKFSSFPVTRELDFGDLTIPDDCHLPPHLVRNYSQLINLNEIYRFKQSTSVVRNILQAQEVPVEIVCKKQPDVLRYTGVIDLKAFNYVNQSFSRQAVPLKAVEVKSADKKAAAKSPKDKKKGKDNIDEALSQKTAIDLAEKQYEVCEDGYTTCLVLIIMLDRPLITLKTEVLSRAEIEIAHCEKFTEAGIPMLNKEELNSIFKSQILKFATNEDLKAYHKCKQRELYPMNDIWSIAENDFFGSCALQLADKYNFNKPIDEDELDILLRNSYIYLINKTYDVMNETDDREEQKEALKKFRLQCAEECRELGLKCAKDFHLMNLKDTGCSPRSLIDYALFNLRIGDEAMALDCAMDAVAKDPSLYDAYLLQAYVFYTRRDTKACESMLQYATKACPNFLEAWIALYLLHAEDADSAEVEFITQAIDTAFKFPYIGHLHKQECIFWPGECSSEFLVGAMSNFIAWGCIQFAEVALGLSIYKLGTNNYHYLIHQAAIYYVRGRYIDALQALKQINTNCCCKLLKIKRLSAHCFLSLKSSGVLPLMDVLAPNFYENKVYTLRCNLMNLKVAKYFLECGKYRDGRYYLKKCCKKSGTYASLIELGNSCVQIRSFEMALRCFKLAQKINPYDWFPWARLAVVYFRSGLKEQYRICSKQARENKITDEIISHELDKIDETISD